MRGKIFPEGECSYFSENSTLACLQSVPRSESAIIATSHLHLYTIMRPAGSKRTNNTLQIIQHTRNRVLLNTTVLPASSDIELHSSHRLFPVAPAPAPASQRYYRHDYDRQRSHSSAQYSPQVTSQPVLQQPVQILHNPHNLVPAYLSPHHSEHSGRQPASSSEGASPSPPRRRSKGSRRHEAPPHNQALSEHHPSRASDKSTTETPQVIRAESTSKHPVRMLTLLIEDLRTGESQLAEIKVPLRPSLQPGDGFWADAQDVCNLLQAGPSRIDGTLLPAVCDICNSDLL